MFQNVSLTKPKPKIQYQKTPQKQATKDLELTPWENNQANQYLSGQIQIQSLIRDKEINNESKMSNKNNSKRSASQNYNKNTTKTFKNQVNIIVDPYIDKFQQVLMQRCRSSTFNKKKSTLVSQSKQSQQEQAFKELFVKKQNNQKVSYNPQVKQVNTQPLLTQHNNQKICQSDQFNQHGFRHILNTTYLTFYDEPSFTPFERSKKKLNNIKKNFYTVETESKQSKKESVSFKNFQNFLKMKKLQKFHALIKKNQEAKLQEPEIEKFFSLSLKKETTQILKITQFQNPMTSSIQIENSPKPIGKLFQITQIPKDKFGLYLKTQQVQSKNFKRPQVNLFKLQKQSQCLLRMKSQPNSPTKKRNQRLYTTQTVINEKCNQNLSDWQPPRLKKIVSTNIQKIKKNLKALKDNERYKIVDKKMLQIQGGKYYHQK